MLSFAATLLLASAAFPAGGADDAQARFLAFQLASDPSPVFVGGVELKRTISRKDAVAYAWVDVGRLEVKTPEYKAEPGKVLFYLESPNGRIAACDASVSLWIKNTNVAGVLFLPGTGRDFVAPKLVAELDGERIGEWTLDDYPTDKPIIPDDEPTVTSIPDILGLSLNVSTEVTPRENKVSRNSGFVNLRVDVNGVFDPNYEYWVNCNIVESTYRKELHWGMSGFLYDKPRRTGTGQAAEFAAFADRVRVVGDVEVNQVYVEPATFKGLEVVRDRNRELWIVNRREQKVVLSTGVNVVMPVFERKVTASQQPGMLTAGFLVEFPGRTSGLSLPGAGDKLVNTEGVRLECKRLLVFGGREIPGGARASTAWTLDVGLESSSLRAGSRFDVTVEVRHVATVGKKEYRVLVPLERKQ